MMRELLRVRYNVIDINTISSFSQIQGGLNNGCKDVYFLAFMGVNASYVNDIVEMDRKLGMQMLSGKGYYKRVAGLPSSMSNDNVTYYTKCYEEWIKSGKKEIEIKIIANKFIELKKTLSEICLLGQRMYENMSVNASESMVKNFVVKVLFWMDQILCDKDFNLDEKLSSKIVVSNVKKKQELLFWYLISQMGNDVLLLQTENDLDCNIVDNNVKKKVLGDWKKIDIPEYQEPVKEKETSAKVCNTIGQEPGTNVKMTIPPRKNRNHTVKNSEVQTGVKETERKEKSYEELAMLASSVVLIVIHDSKGDVIGTGSGIMIGSKGYILTNNHVASGGKYYSVKIEDDDKVYDTEEIIKYNPVLDLAVIRIQRQLKAIPVYKGNEKLVRGQKVVAIGSPLGLFNSVSDGIISGFRTINSVDMIQFTAPISHGSSGGAVLNMYGEVIGISTAGFDSGQNINLAVGYENINSFISGFI